MTMTACKTRQVITQPLKEQGPEYLFEQMKKSELKYSTFSARFGAEAVVDQNNTSFSGAIYIVRDSLIWMSVSKFGLEVARFLITPDSAKMLNRINDSYFIGDFNYVCGLFQVDFDFDILQALITGNDFSYYDNDVFKASVENKSYKLSTIGRRKLKKYVIKENEAQRVLIQDILLDPENFKITKISIKEVKQENRKFESFYSDFRLLENQLTPYSLKVEITDDKKRIDVSVSFTKISLNTKENASFKIPADFKRVEK
jgi:hypothetical protein